MVIITVHGNVVKAQPLIETESDEQENRPRKTFGRCIFQIGGLIWLLFLVYCGFKAKYLQSDWNSFQFMFGVGELGQKAERILRTMNDGKGYPLVNDTEHPTIVKIMATITDFNVTCIKGGVDISNETFCNTIREMQYPDNQLGYDLIYETLHFQRFRASASPSVVKFKDSYFRIYEETQNWCGCIKTETRTAEGVDGAESMEKLDNNDAMTMIENYCYDYLQVSDIARAFIANNLTTCLDDIEEDLTNDQDEDWLKTVTNSQNAPVLDGNSEPLPQWDPETWGLLTKLINSTMSFLTGFDMLIVTGFVILWFGCLA